MHPTLVLLSSVLLLIRTHFTDSAVAYQCGVQARPLLAHLHNAWDASDCQWPWHIALYRKTRNGTSYQCGGTLLDQRHILTAAHCAVNRNRYPLKPSDIEIHLGQHNISKTDNPSVKVAQVVEVHVHPEFSAQRNDLAVLKLDAPVEYTDCIIPICLNTHGSEKDFATLVGQRGWVAGWGRTENGTTSDVLQTAQMPIVDYLQCLDDDRALFGNLLSPNVFCAGDRNGTSVGKGDSGGGMYVMNSYGRWVLRGVVSFAADDKMRVDVDTSKFQVFVNVQRYLPWIENITQTGNNPGKDESSKRISETECERFEGLSRRRSNGVCLNARHPHTVGVLYEDGETKCSGVLLKEDSVLTACHCIKKLGLPTKVQIEKYGDISIVEGICHPDYSLRTFYHDLAILKLSEPVRLSANIIPACLANSRSERLYGTLLQTGISTDEFTKIKQFVESDDNLVITASECERTLNSDRKLPQGITPSEFCAINTDRLRTISRGIAGGPLQAVDQRSCVHPVVGMVTAGTRDDEDKREQNVTVVDFYVRIAYHLDWIEYVVWGEEPDDSVELTTKTNSRFGTKPQPVTESINRDFVFPKD